MSIDSNVKPLSMTDLVEAISDAMTTSQMLGVSSQKMTMSSLKSSANMMNEMSNSSDKLGNWSTAAAVLIGITAGLGAIFGAGGAAMGFSNILVDAMPVALSVAGHLAQSGAEIAKGVTEAGQSTVKANLDLQTVSAQAASKAAKSSSGATQETMSAAGKMAGDANKIIYEMETFVQV